MGRGVEETKPRSTWSLNWSRSGINIFDPTVKAYAENGRIKWVVQSRQHANIQLLKQPVEKKIDATMAHFSWPNFKSGDLLFHFEGSYHSHNRPRIILVDQ